MEVAFTGRTVGVLDAQLETGGTVMSGDKRLGTANALVADAMVVFLLLNEARRRFVMWVYGVPREDTGVMTVVAIGSMAEVLKTEARVIAAAAVPSFAATLMGGAVLKETAHGIAGNWSRTAPAFGWLITFAVVARWFGPGLRASYRDAREGFHDVETGSRRFLEVVGGE